MPALGVRIPIGELGGFRTGLYPGQAVFNIVDVGFDFVVCQFPVFVIGICLSVDGRQLVGIVAVKGDSCFILKLYFFF